MPIGDCRDAFCITPVGRAGRAPFVLAVVAEKTLSVRKCAVHFQQLFVSLGSDGPVSLRLSGATEPEVSTTLGARFRRLAWRSKEEDVQSHHRIPSD
ncbi:MAG: hypothetical protein DME59_09690 [Verrucomicrobia bacterium]|nr:MAG: hypothetical protein DME59_09690 [Verrucomicrobiota bacterium]